MQRVQREAWGTETQGAFLEKGQAGKVALAEAELECVLVVAESAAADSAKPPGEGLRFDCG